MATLQTGTAPNQIPTNGDLGDLAFQSKESVQFTGGSGALSSINLNQIYKEIAATAVDVFVYDTSKDSDGGAWRKRCQHTSWYNEELNTATRGSRREFPAVAVIVATTTTLTIYDGDDPAMPMWMVFEKNAANDAWQYWYLGRQSVGTLTSVAMLNGSLYVAQAYVGTFFEALLEINFLRDDGVHHIDSVYKHQNPISSRNGKAGGYYKLSTAAIINIVSVNDVAMTVLPNAPIDAATGLPIPTIGVGCTGGLSIIQHDGTVTNRSSAWFSDGGVYEIAFDDMGGYWYTNAYYAEVGGYPNHAGLVAYAPSVRESGNLARSDGYGATNGVHYLQGTDNGTSTFWGLTEGLWLVDANNGHANAGKFSLTSKQHVGTQYGLSVFDTNYSIGSRGMARYVTSKYNTGWMPGDIRGAWLSDTTTTAPSTAILAEDFSSAGSWGLADGPTISGGVLTLANVTSSRATLLSWNGTTGKQYIGVIVVTANANSGTFGLDDDGAGAGVGGATSYGSWSGTGTFSFSFTKTASGRFRLMRNSGGPIDITSFYVYEAEQDRSVNAKGLQVFGSITKTPVATGADLVGYSGFGSGKYLYYPTSTNLSFGSGDFSLIMWMKPTQTNVGYSFMQSYGIRTAYTSGKLRFHVYSNSLTPQYIDSKTVPVGIWHQVVCVRRGGLLEIYVNGVLSIDTIWSNATSTFSTATETLIGVSDTTGGSTYTGELALIRLSGTVPSAEQIAKMYEDEKYLFQDNAKATLYGTSDSVTALAYDEDTQLLHAGTSSGRSVFRGLRRVDNTTTAVGAAISAANGLVAED